MSQRCSVIVLFFLFTQCGKPVEKRAVDEAEASVWTTAQLSSSCRCSDSTSYRIFNRNATTSNLLIFFSGGGACWDSETCALPKNSLSSASGFFYPRVFDIAKHATGIFQFEHPRNPFKHWNVVMVPYCTGDLHFGNSRNEYSSEKSVVKIHHNGRSNVLAALSWAYKHHPSPGKVLVAGESAGGFASIYWLNEIAAHYPHAKLYQLSDGAFIKSKRMNSVIDSVWKADPITQFGIPSTEDVMSTAYMNTRQYLKSGHVIYMQSNTLYDNLMTYYASALARSQLTDEIKRGWSHDMTRSVRQLKQSIPDYFYYVTDYKLDSSRLTTPHTLLWSNDFYGCIENDQPYYQWLGNIVNHDKASSVGEDLLQP